MYRSGASFNRRPRRQSAWTAVAPAVPVFHRALPLILMLALAALLAACAQPGQRLAKTAATAPATVEQAAKAAGDGNADAGAAGTAKPAAAAPATVQWDDADTLMGLQSADVRQALGAPARIRDEDTARIYQYVGGDCVLDLFLYQEAGIYRVTYAEARTVKAEHKAVEACLKTLPAPIVAASSLPST